MTARRSWPVGGVLGRDGEVMAKNLMAKNLVSHGSPPGEPALDSATASTAPVGRPGRRGDETAVKHTNPILTAERASKRPLSLCAGLASLVLGPSAALGLGFEVGTQGAKAAGQADAFVAQADDPSAVHYNPAGLTQTAGTMTMSGEYGLFLNYRFRGPSGDAGMNEPAYVPHLFAVTDAGTRDWRFGLGVTNTFGLGEDWTDTGPLRHSVTHAMLAVINLQPTVAYRVDEHLSLGGAVNVYYADIELARRVDFGTAKEGEFRFAGDDLAFGGTFAARYQFDDRHAVGAVYRTPFQFAPEGTVRVRGAPGPAGGPTVELGPSPATARGLHLPQTLSVGYAWRPTDRLTVEFDVNWTDWDSLNQVQLRSRDPAFRQAASPLRFEYRDTFGYRAGAEYRVDANWFLRAGYAYGETSTPEGTFNPLVNDLYYQLFSVGVGFRRPDWQVDVAYQYILREERTIRQSVNSPPGTYEDQTHAVMVSLTVRL